MNNLYRLGQITGLSLTRLIKRVGLNKNRLRNCSKVVQKINDPLVNFVPPPFLKLPPKLEIKKQKFDNILVLDFEATCDSPVNCVPQEIIEFPVLKLNGKTFEIESEFHSYVRPVIHPDIPKYCTQLTGITQEIVDDSPIFEDVFEKFQRWLEKENLLNGAKFAIATCGEWDLKYVFPIQCKGLRIPLPPYVKKWINVKVSFAEMTQVYPRNMITMMKYCQLQHEGKLHSGIDDCRNLARVVKNLAERGFIFDYNGKSN